MSGLFATLNVGKRGLYAQQGALDVTSHNIANSNTEGYTRQRAIMETTRPFGMPSMNCQIGPGQVGTGVEISKIQRVRDTFMDYQVRRETSTLGQYEARDKYLSEVEGIFNEPSDTGVSTLIGKFFDAWQEVAKHPEGSNARTVLASQASALANELNHTYSQLTKVKENAQESIKQATFDINNALDRVDKLNQQIMAVKISGMEPNDLMDKRDLLLDELSKKFNIVVERDKFESINLKPKYLKAPDGSELKIETKDKNGKTNIQDPLLVRKNPKDEVMRFSYIKSIEPTDPKKKFGEATEYKITYLKNGDKDKVGTFKLNIKSDGNGTAEEKLKRLDESRIIWSTSNKNDDAKNGLAVNNKGEVIGKNPVEFKELALFDLKGDEYKGELKGFMTVQQDVDDYIDQINKLAKGIALSVNAIHSGKEDAGTAKELKPGENIQADYMPFFVNGEIADKNYKIIDGKKVLYDSKNNIGTTKVDALQNVLNAETEITAANISINKQIVDDVMQIKTRINDEKYDLESNNTKDGEQDGARALAVAQLRDKLLKIQNITKGMTRKEFIQQNGENNKLTKDITLGLNTINGDINGMKIDSYFKDTVDKLGVQEQEAQRIVKNQGALLKEFSQRRESISGVSLNEEMANIVQYQHAYQANAKIIATTDQLLDVVINGLKR
ncbi:flagellar hook-associated protein FlgK [Clostridium botulinum C]|uniref:Flagellar hook-associated protein 1 n=2 Tax=Clostridium botulinum TaxID=1491 RepID=A0A9Q4TJQ7_CLOBO|nr:flagellar hook-associated protein FlgK [Clostridium botulinum]EGO87768.1 flagellar hook protein FlgK [Clostridium botulinum C str. Stockholm]MCD3194070.1 flagellar hook-associated protein FlgK [Clostridium botulinum C]MCD3199301.1 flagellar hook-associated protein FlgK [Clostridium botulinum C]MCD3204776.1 flagellar hook-associated protein FlgK [Clostridium botulinum C]MCD3207601.1 flagellar hook-associated protein FlgK [Clostridium botulinum C]